jgi:HAE1 family hydrophobic/amphiphilic exporter-1
LRRQGLPRTEAVLAASRDRLRPILMTTFAFVAGMLPLILSNGVGAGMSKAMASVVVGGQTFSLLLTLVAVPVIYTWFDDLARRALKNRKPPIDRGAEEVGVVDIHKISSTQA